MIYEFTLKNDITKQVVSFGQEVDKFDFVFKDGGIDWGGITANHNTYSYPTQIGETINRTKMNTRDISIVAYVVSNVSIDEIVEKGYKQAHEDGYSRMLEKKKILTEMINPDNLLKLTIGNYYIEGKPSHVIKFSNEENDNNEYFCMFLLDIFCANPMFKKNTVMKSVLSGSTPEFHFPLVFTDEGIVMSTRVNFLLLAVENEGSSEIGGNIIFEAKGEVVNPSVENINTGQKMMIDKTLQDGEKIVITTTDGENKGIKGYVNDEEMNYFKYWDFENDWMKFPIGTSVIGYSTENGSELLLNVYVELNPEKFGLEEM